jgi:hypothetical protein
LRHGQSAGITRRARANRTGSRARLTGGFVAREGLEVADVFRHLGPTFRDQNGVSLSAARRRRRIRSQR